MWLYDIGYNAYSRDMNRHFFIVHRSATETRNYGGVDIKFPKRRLNQEVHTIVEEWHTPESQGNTGDWDYYTFVNCADASFFLAELIMKLNSPRQRELLAAAEDFVTELTKGHKRARKQTNQEDKHHGKQQRQLAEEQEKRRKKLVLAKKPKHADTQIEQDEKQHESLWQERQRQLAEARKARLQKCVYVFAMENGTVKIGISNNVDRRRNAIRGSSGMKIDTWCYTKPMHSDKAFEIEATCHHFFRERNTKGEFFKVPYDEAKDYLSTLAPVVWEKSLGEHND